MTIKPIRFWINYEMTPPAEYVELTNSSCMTETGQFLSTTPIRIKELMPNPKGVGPTFERQREIWAAIEPAYRAWKAGEEIPEDGTPLAMWPGVTASEAEVLARFDIRTVEAVRDIPEALFTKIPLPRIRQKATMAKAFLDNAGKAATAKAAAEQSAVISELQRQLAELQSARADREIDA
jgi:hypothetical protein